MKAFWQWIKSLFSAKQTEQGVSPHEPKPVHQIEIPPGQIEPPWMLFAKAMLGKKETDTGFAREMIPLWKKLFGRSIGAIAGNSNAWCGLFVGRCLMEAKMSWQKGGELAGNWREYGVALDWKKNGIPEGAILHINHSGNCKKGSSGNHVTFAATDHAPGDLKTAGVFFGLGGNQGNKVCVAVYSTKEICEARWPKEYAIPAPVLVSKKIGGEKPGSTK